MAGYARQSSADIVATAVVRANPLNVEFNALRDTFALATGHTHDGSATEGGYIPLIADSDALNKVAIDTSNNRVGIFVEVSSAAVEQIRIQDGAIVPVTDSDIDLGTSSLEFKDLFLDGTAHIDTLDVDANAGIIGNLTVSGNTTLGDAASDTVTVTADVASPLIPSTDDTYDLGASGSEWRNLYIDGTANIDALVADTADINGGTADGVVIGGSSAAAGTFTSLTATGTSTLTTVDINGGAIDGAIIGANSAAAITGTTITGTSLVGAVTGNADTATALETARTIGGVSFDGAANINLPGVNTSGNQDTSGTAANATVLETARTIGGVSFDGSANIDLSGVNTAGNQDTSGNAATATTLATARTIAGQSFNGSANITIAATDLSDTDQSLATGDNVQFAQVTTTANVIVGGDLTVNGTTTTVDTTNMVVSDALIELGSGTTGTPSNDAGLVIERGDAANAFIGYDESADKFTVGTGTFTGASTGNLSITTGTLVANIEGDVTGDLTGNADTATALATARTIAGQSFNGTGNISIAPTDLTGVNATATELNIMDGGTSASSTTLADADRVVVNDNGTMKQVALTDFETYMETSLDTLSNVTTVGALNSGSITSGFGSINVGNSDITTAGRIIFGRLSGVLSSGADNVTNIVTSVDTGSDNSELATAGAIEARIQAVNGASNNVTGLNATGAEINTVADPDTSIGTTAVAGGDGIVTQDTSGNVMLQTTVDTFDTYLAQTTKTLTNKTLTSPVITGMHLNDSGFTVEGSAADGNDTTVAFTNPTADRTITFPNATGTVAMAGDVLPLSGGTMTGNLALGDNVKATFGAGSDLKIYHDGSNSYIDDTNGTGDLIVKANNFKVRSTSDENYINANSNGALSLFYDNAAKLATTATGINVTGNVVVSGTVDGRDIATNIPSSLGSAGQILTVNSGGSAAEWAEAGGGASALTIEAKTSAYTVVAADLGKVINCTANTFTVSLTAASTLGAGFNVIIWNTSATSGHAITIDPNGSETIDGLATLILRRGEGMQVICDGSNFQTGDKKTMRGYADNILSTEARPVASGNRSVSLGPLSQSTSSESFSAGYYARGTGAYSVAIGGRPTASSTGAIAIGFEASGTAVMATAIGGNSSSQGAKASGSGSVALGGSYASGTNSFAAAINNNASSYGATGANSIAMGNHNKSTGTQSISLGGYNNVSSGNSSFVTGYQALASGGYAIAMGYQCQATEASTVALGYQADASAIYSIAIGNNAKSAVDRQIAFSAGRFAALGDAQGSIFILRANASNDAAKVLTTNNSTAGANNQIVAASDTCITFHGTITAMQNGAQAYGGWEIKGMLVNDGGTTSLALGNVSDMAANNASSWAVALSADNTNNALKIQVTGEAGHNIRWVANVQTSEVTYA